MPDLPSTAPGHGRMSNAGARPARDFTGPYARTARPFLVHLSHGVGLAARAGGRFTRVRGSFGCRIPIARKGRAPDDALGIERPRRSSALGVGRARTARTELSFHFAGQLAATFERR